jgi:7-cyano-7-deazaguanine synthase
VNGGEFSRPSANKLRGLEPEVLVLLSGGIDSTACLDFYLQLGRPSCALFIDYGQPAATREWQAACDVANFYNVPVFSLQWDGAKPKDAGLIYRPQLDLKAL